VALQFPRDSQTRSSCVQFASPDRTRRNGTLATSFLRADILSDQGTFSGSMESALPDWCPGNSAGDLPF
jgi:hypothetical protein